ncbi:MAG: pitrilysin family protein [Syntrophales bacterium]|jgi:predicted Zn-dependent peptidase
MFLLPVYILYSAIAYAAEGAQVPLQKPDSLKYHPIHFAPPRAERVLLDNGIILYIFEDNEVPLLDISAVIRTGSNYDPTGKEGLAEIAGTVMRTGGTNSLTGDAVDEALDFFAGSLHVSMNRDSGLLNLSILKKDLDEGLNIFSQIITKPAFEENKLKLAKNLLIEELRRIADDPKKLAFREFKRVLYQNNPAGRFPSTLSVENIERDDLVEFHRTFFYPENIIISVTGDISKREAIAKIKQYLGSWVASGKNNVIPPIPVKQKGRIYFLSKNTPQSIIICANFAPSKKEPDAYPFEVLDFILGSGGFKSRIFQEIRNSRGLAYSTGSFYTKRSDYGVFGAYAITESDSTAKVLSLLRSIVEDARMKSIDKKELEWAIKSINNNFIFSFQSADQIAHQQLMVEYDKLPPDYLATYRDKIAKVQPEELKRAAMKYLSPDETVTFILGNESAYNQVSTRFGNVSRIEDQR